MEKERDPSVAKGREGTHSGEREFRVAAGNRPHRVLCNAKKKMGDTPEPYPPFKHMGTNGCTLDLHWSHWNTQPTTPILHTLLDNTSLRTTQKLPDRFSSKGRHLANFHPPYLGVPSILLPTTAPPPGIAMVDVVVWAYFFSNSILYV